MKTLPDYREIEVPVSLSSLKDYIEPMLYSLGIVRDCEEIIKLEETDNTPDVIMVKIKLKKRQQVEVIDHK